MKLILSLFLLLSSATVLSAQETIRKIEYYPVTIEQVYYVGNKEVARIILDLDGNLVDRNGRIPDGVVKGYYNNGNLASIEYFKNNKEVGRAKTYYENGRQESERHFKNGKLIYKKVYSEIGKILEEKHYKK